MKATLSTLFRYLARKSWILAVIAIDCAILAYILSTVVFPPSYAAEAQILVTGEDRVLSDCVYVVKSNALCNRLISSFSLTSSTEQVASSILVERVDESSYFKIRVVCRDPETSLVLTSAVAYYTTEMISQLYEGAAAIVYEEATLPEDIYGLEPLHIALITFGASFIISAFAFSIRIFAGYRLFDKKSTARLLGLPVLAVIPSATDRNGGIRE